MLPKPSDQALSIEGTGCHPQNDTLLLINRRVDLPPVEDEECLHGRVTYPLISVNERMIGDQRETERCCLGRQIGRGPNP